MRDVVMVLLIAAFFGVCIAYVWWCDRIIGPDPVDLADDEDHHPEFVSPHSSSTTYSVTQTGGDEVSA
jgi:hypothetical protein